MNPTKPDAQPANLAVQNENLRNCANTQTPVWLCSCGEPSKPGVLHRADRPCYRVEAKS